jgi:hypothetical protein
VHIIIYHAVESVLLFAVSALHLCFSAMQSLSGCTSFEKS